MSKPQHETNETELSSEELSSVQGGALLIPFPFRFPNGVPVGGRQLNPEVMRRSREVAQQRGLMPER